MANKQNKTITLTLSTKAAMDMLAAPGTPKSVIALIVKAIRAETVYPKGKVSAAISAASTSTSRASVKKPNKAASPKSEKSAMNGTSAQATN